MIRNLAQLRQVIRKPIGKSWPIGMLVCDQFYLTKHQIQCLLISNLPKCGILRIVPERERVGYIWGKKETFRVEF